MSGSYRWSTQEVDSCRFCDLVQSAAPAAYDEPLLVSDRFLVVPSLGGFVEGWLLVVSRDHMLNIRETPVTDRADLDALVTEASEIVRREYGPVVVFEHGPGRCGSAAGCSIDHAHLHIVPCSTELREEIEAETQSGLKLSPVQSLFEAAAVPPESSYIFLEEPTGQRYLGFTADIESQLVRRVLARRMGRWPKFDWREDLALESVQRTQGALALR